mmetsp:Transcript_15600/g.24831  ORF Transcript_15600/g.24831 Transcript_15600/m.24831 type:complete len:588 (+) Transcript_15600:53-1816(+)
MSDPLCALGEACLKGEAVSYPGSTFFIDPDSMTALQLAWAFVSYGYVLFVSANMIGDGAELLLLIPSYKGLVASVVLPILGAVPDGMMVLFSGIGPLAAAQENVAVGVGALAGSTIMLLTLPWVCSFYGGKVDMKGGVPEGYEAKKKSERDTKTGVAVLFSSGVEFDQGARTNAKIMMYTCAAYAFIQIPALTVDDQKTRAEFGSEGSYIHEVMAESGIVHKWSLVGAIATALMLAYYLYLQIKAAQMPQEPAEKETTPGGVTYADFLPIAAPAPVVRMKDGWLEDRGIRMHIQYLRDHAASQCPDKTRGAVYVEFLEKKPELPKDIADELSTMFYRSADRGSISKDKMQALLEKIGLGYTEEQFDAMFKTFDKDKSGSFECAEFLQFFQEQIVFSSEKLPWEGADDDDDDEDEMPDEFKSMGPDEQRKSILKESFQQMIMGTVLVLIFSDPMVDVMSSIATMIGVPAFYVAFILSPLASNASELVASFKLASKKSKESITQSLQTLEGAAIMNNTFCLGIFYLLIYMQGLAWKFTAETLSIVVVQLLVGAMVLAKSNQSMMYGIVVFLFYPLSLVLVYVLEANGID